MCKWISTEQQTNLFYYINSILPLENFDLFAWLSIYLDITLLCIYPNLFHTDATRIIDVESSKSFETWTNTV